ncbi:MAG: GAF domain-containing protein, partial [Actinobacteria bacterium]|nr:GAF domain-containing protein [Actinomycetota bacterium]
MRSQPGELQLQLQRLVMSVAAALDADAAFIALWTLDGTTLPLPSIDSHLAASCGQGPQVFQELEGQLSHSSYSLEGTPLRLEGVVMGSAYAESGWAVPIGRGDHYFGVLYARHRATVGFPARDVLLLKTVAEAAETALDAALAADHAKSQEERIHALLDVAKEISTLGGLDRALGLICRKASELASAEIAYVALADIAQKEIRMRTTLGIANPEWNTMRMAFGEGIGGLVAQQREAVIVRDYESYQHQTRADIREMAGMEGLRAVLAVPMITGHRVLGVLFIADRQPARFTDTDARLLQGLADQAAIAIANSRLYEQERRELEVHDRLSSIVLRNGDYATMVDALHGLVGNPVALYDSHFNLLGCYPASLAPDLKAEVERMRMLVLTERGDLRHDLSADTRLKNQAFMLPTPEDHESALPCAIAPAASGDRVMGYVQVIELDRYLQDQDLRVAERAAVILALRMMTERVEAEVEQRLRGDLLIDILSENIDNVDNAVARFSHLGYDFNLPHIAVVFDAKEERRSPSRKTNNSQDSLVLVKNSLLHTI